MAISQVIHHLRQLDQEHAALLELGHAKTEVLIHNNVDELARIMQDEARLLKQIVIAENGWIAAARDVFSENGLEPEPELTMSDLIKLVFQAREKQELRDLQAGLTDKLQQLKRLNATNQLMIEQSLLYIHYSMDIMTGNDDQDVVYGRPDMQGQGKQAPRSGFFDWKA